MRTRPLIAALSIALCVALSPAASQPRFDIIDMHFHAERPDAEGPPGGRVCAPYEDWSPRDAGAPMGAYLNWFTLHPPCAHVLTAPTDPAALRDRGLAMLARYNILALAGGDAATVEDFRKHAPGRIMPSAGFGQANDFPSVAALRALHKQGSLAAISEISAQYAGIGPDDPKLEPYYALAEELDIPVGIHLGPGPPGTAYFATPAYRAALGDPFRLEPVLLRHPRLRLYAMHAGWPMGEAMIAMLYAHPQLYVDVGILDYAYPPADFYAYLKRLIDAGFERRIMFGSDHMIWPDAIPLAIDRIEKAPFLNARQKRLIFHDNAARFLRIAG